jgi:hypothetical protein
LKPPVAWAVKESAAGEAIEVEKLPSLQTNEWS